MSTIYDSKEESIDKTKNMIKIMQAYVDGSTVECQHKGFTAWGRVDSIGYFRHQWDTRNENYRVIKDGVVVLEVGEEFDDKKSADDHKVEFMKAKIQAKNILNPTGDMWSHFCKVEKGTIFTEKGSPCNWCDDHPQLPKLKVL